jgi:RimJ/RimL family protein N-acetyltransferase
VSLARLEAQFDRRLTEDDDPRHVRFAVQERGDERGELIGAAYVMGERIDDITYGLLRREWQPDDAEE